MFTPEELAEMARADAEIEASFCLTNEELKQSREIDRDVVVGRMDRDTRRRAEYQKAYREANRDKVAEYQKAYREANRDKVAEYQKAIADARKARKWTQKELAQRLGISRSLVAQWEVGIAPANWELIFDALPELKEVSA